MARTAAKPNILQIIGLVWYMEQRPLKGSHVMGDMVEASSPTGIIEISPRDSLPVLLWAVRLIKYAPSGAPFCLGGLRLQPL